MIFIAHRGNTIGPYKELENEPEYINVSLNLDYDVEVDVWLINEQFYLGHDKPQYKIPENFLENDRLWCHAKNFEALYAMSKNNLIHSFSHDKDNYVYTSKKYLWTFPDNNLILTNKSIAVMPDHINYDWDYAAAFAVCSDYVSILKNK